MTRCMLLIGFALCAGCELTELTLAEPQDIVIAEVVLRQGERRQTAFLHRTLVGASQTVRNASVVVTEEGTGREMVYSMAADSVCIDDATPATAAIGTCYAVTGSFDMVRPATRYSLRIEMADRRVMTATTRVPGNFRIVAPNAPSCRLEERTIFELTWTQSAGASVYIAETRLFNIYTALRNAGVAVQGQGTIDLSALAISAADTIMTFPADFGIFDRFDDETHAVLIAIRNGLPLNVRAGYVVAAADNNYVSWVRGGNFNPSGLVRISSIQGEGRGLFGSLVARAGEMRTGSGGGPIPTCR